jgi:hypothetical protein
VVFASLEIAAEQSNATAIYQSELRYLRERPEFDQIHAAAIGVQRVWLEIIEAGAANGSFRNDIPPRVFYRLVRDAVWLSVRWHDPNGAYTNEQLANDLTSVFLHGMSMNALALNPGLAAR